MAKIVNNQVESGRAINYLPLISQFYKEVPKQMTPSQTLRYILRGEVFLLGSEVDTVPKAYTVVQADDADLVLLQAYSTAPMYGMSLFKYVCKWATRNQFERLTAYVTRDPSLFDRRFGMSVIGYKIGRDLDGKQGSED